MKDNYMHYDLIVNLDLEPLFRGIEANLRSVYFSNNDEERVLEIFCTYLM